MAEAHQPVVVVGVDGFESSEQALRWAVRQTELIAVVARQLPEMSGYVSRDHDVDAANLLDRVLDEVLDPTSTVQVVRRS